MADQESEIKGVREDKELYDKIISLYKKRQAWMIENRIYEDAHVCRKFYDNEMWGATPKLTRPEYLTKFAVPIAYDVIETSLSVATAQIPTPDVEPEISYDKVDELIASLPPADQTGTDVSQLGLVQKQAAQIAHSLSQEIVKHWRTNNLQNMFRNSYRENKKVGSHFIRITQDPETLEPVEESCELESVLAAPGVNTIRDHGDAPFLFAPIRTVRQAKKEFGLTEINAGAISSQAALRKSRSPATGWAGVGDKIISGGNKVIDSITGRGPGDDDGFIMPIYCYMPAEEEFEDVKVEQIVKDETGDAPVYGEDGQVQKMTVTEQRLKFPSGYKCVVVIQGHVGWIVAEEDCPYAPYGKPQPPFVKYPTGDEFYGTSVLKQIKQLIEQVCLVVSNLTDVIRYTGNAPLIIHRRSKRIDGRPVDAKNDAATSEDPLKAIPGEVWEETVANSIRWLSPPGGMRDSQWYLEWIMGIIDRVTHLSNAVRGLAQYSQESGKKIRELRSAAVVTFGPELDDVSTFCAEIYRLLAWIYINMMPPDHVIMQKDEDETGEANFKKFMPAVGKNYTFRIDVSGSNLLPPDPEGDFQQAVELYQVGVQSQTKIIPPEMLVDMSNLEEKQRAKRYMAEEQAKADQEIQKQMAFKQFVDLGTQISQVQPSSPEEEELFIQMSDIIQQVPEILSSDIMGQLPPRTSAALVANFSKNILKRITQPIQQTAPKEAPNGKV